MDETSAPNLGRVRAAVPGLYLGHCPHLMSGCSLVRFPLAGRTDERIAYRSAVPRETLPRIDGLAEVPAKALPFDELSNYRLSTTS